VLILRLPSLVGGTAALWLTFAWMRRILGETPALAGLGFMAERSTIWAIVQGLFLLGALLTHYTTVVVLLSLVLDILLRSLLDGVPRRILFTIGVSQGILATLLRSVRSMSR
jgi:hypothetical protein